MYYDDQYRRRRRHVSAKLALVSADIIIARGTIVIGIAGTVREVQSDGTGPAAEEIGINA